MKTKNRVRKTSKITIRVKLIIMSAIGSVSALLISSAGVYSDIVYQRGIDELTRYNTSVVAVNRALYDVMDADSWMEGLIRRVNDGVKDPAAPDGEVAKGLEHTRENTKEDMGNIQRDLLSPQGQKTLDTVIPLWEGYWNSVDEVFKTLQSVDNQTVEKAKELIDKNLEEHLWPINDNLLILHKEIESESKTVEQQTLNTRWKVLPLVLILLVSALAVIGIVTIPIIRRLHMDLTEVQKLALQIEKGDLTDKEVSVVEIELSQIANSFIEAKNRLRNIIASTAKASEKVQNTAEELGQDAQEASSNSNEISSQSAMVAAAAEQVSANVQTVAAGVEEMGSSIRQISQDANESARIAANATQITERTNELVSKLGESSEQIGEVIKTISSISEQTNLLALNATIEAARAGEAGKGFAVVAGEVKELAAETGSATEVIAQRIEHIQQDTKISMQAIGEISEIIQHVNEISGSIAAAVEEQTATTNEMSRSVQEAAQGAGEIAQNIAQLADSSTKVSQTLNNMDTTSDNLTHLTTDLNQEIQYFKYQEDESEK